MTFLAWNLFFSAANLLYLEHPAPQQKSYCYLPLGSRCARLWIPHFGTGAFGLAVHNI